MSVPDDNAQDSVKAFLEARAGGDSVVHYVEACPERIALSGDACRKVTVSRNELEALKLRHRSCPTCQHLEVASSTDRVRFLLASLARR